MGAGRDGLIIRPSLAVALVAPVISGAVHARLARAAEAAGFAAVALDEHPIPSESWRRTPEGHDCRSRPASL